MSVFLKEYRGDKIIGYSNAVYNELKNVCDEEKIIVFGRSISSGPACEFELKRIGFCVLF
jgi:hypothetical protein